MHYKNVAISPKLFSKKFNLNKNSEWFITELKLILKSNETITGENRQGYLEKNEEWKNTCPRINCSNLKKNDIVTGIDKLTNRRKQTVVKQMPKYMEAWQVGDTYFIGIIKCLYLKI